MKLTRDTFFRGPNVWGSQTGLLATVEIDEQDARRLAWKPGVQEVEQITIALRRVFAVAAESQTLAQPASFVEARRPLLALVLATCEVLSRDFLVRPCLGRVIDLKEGKLRLFVPCDDRAVGQGALRLAMVAMESLMPTEGQRAPGLLQRLTDGYWSYRRTARAHGLNQTTIALSREAVRRGIPMQRLAAPAEFVQLGQGHLRQRIRETSIDKGGPLAAWMSSDKHVTATILRSLGVPTTRPMIVGSADEAVQAWERLGGPSAVVKPQAGSKGVGVSVNLADEAAVRRAFDKAAAIRKGVMVERFVEGFDHRMLVVDGRLVAVATRRPPRITGDGRRTVAELIAELNADPRRGMPFEKLMEHLVIDDEVRAILRAASLSESSVPEAGRTLVLRGAANISLGGTAIDLTDECHPDNRALSERVAMTIGLGITGIDFLTPDITKSWREVPCAILEVNSTPGLRPHMGSNPDRDIIGPMIDYLFPDGTNGRIPTAGITGSVGKTSTTQLVGALLAANGFTVGVATTQGMFVGGELLLDGDLAGGATAHQLMMDPRVQAGAFELARGGLVKKGLVLDGVDVGAVLNIHDNHVGLDGVTTRNDLARVKRLVVENARKLAVLNADEPLCLDMRQHVRAPVALFSEHADNLSLLAHIAAGGTAAWLEGVGADARIRLVEGARVVGEIATRDIPSTWGGAYRPAAINAMVAALVVHGLGVSFGVIDAALRKFQSTEKANPGRMNFIEGLPFKLLLTWCDGQHPTRELATFAKDIAVTGKRRFMFCAVGNRPDDYLTAMAAASAHGFDEFVVSDWPDLRGREALVVARLLEKGLMDTGVAQDRITVSPDHHTALVEAFARSKAGDLLVIATHISEESRSRIPELAGLP